MLSLILLISLLTCCLADGKCKSAKDCPDHAPCCSNYGYCGKGKDHCAPQFCKDGCWSKKEYKEYEKSGKKPKSLSKNGERKHKKEKKDKKSKGLRRTKL